MLMTANTCKQYTCPLTLQRPGKPGACIGSKCASWRLFVAPYGYDRLWFHVDGKPLAYCGRSGKPPLEQLRIQHPELFNGAVPSDIGVMSLREIRERARRARESGGL